MEKQDSQGHGSTLAASEAAVAPPIAPLRTEAPIRVEGVKPKLRGVPDLIATFFIVPAAATLMALARPGAATHAAVVYTLSLALLFGISTTYHLPMWPLGVRAWLRRADHAAIYVLIAGTYTPVCLQVLPPRYGSPLLVAVWSLAGLGLLKSLFWTTAPRWLNTVVYLAKGWLIVPFLMQVWHSAGPSFVLKVGIGGAFYTVGAIIYAKRWLNVRPTVFGYHEVFHLFVIAAAVCHYAAMWSLLV